VISELNFERAATGILFHVVRSFAVSHSIGYKKWGRHRGCLQCIVNGPRIAVWKCMTAEPHMSITGASLDRPTGKTVSVLAVVFGLAAHHEWLAPQSAGLSFRARLDLS
jgi:hypothetical protein